MSKRPPHTAQPATAPQPHIKKKRFGQDPSEVGDHVFQRRYQGMQIHLAEARRELDEQRDALSKAEQRASDAQLGMQAMDRAWSQLHALLSQSLSHVTGSTADTSEADALEARAKATDGGDAEVKGSFVARVRAAAGQLPGGVGALLEQPLDARVAATVALGTAVADALLRHEKTLAGVAGGDATAAATRVAQLEQQSSATAAQLDALQQTLRLTLDRKAELEVQLKEAKQEADDAVLRQQQLARTLDKTKFQLRAAEEGRDQAIAAGASDDSSTTGSPLPKKMDLSDSGGMSRMHPKQKIKAEAAAAAAASSAGSAELQQQLGVMQSRLDAKEEAMRALESQYQQLLQQHNQLQANANSIHEEAVRSSPIYLDIVQQVTHLNSEQQRHRSQIDDMRAKVRQEELRVAQLSHTKVQQGAAREARLDESLKRARVELKTVTTERDQLAFKLKQVESAKSITLQAEIAMMREAAEKQMGVLKERLERHAKDSVRLAELEAERDQLSAKFAQEVERKDVECADLRKAKAEADRKVQAAEDKGKVSDEELRDTKLLLASFNTISTEQRTLAEVRAAEQKQKEDANVLRAEVARLSATVPRMSKDDAARMRSLQERVEKLSSERVDLKTTVTRLEKARREAQQTLDEQKEEADMLISEMGNMEAAFEQMSEQNARLMAQLAERETGQKELVSVRAKAMQTETMLREKERALQFKVAKMNDVIRRQRELVEASETQIKALEERASSADRRATDAVAAQQDAEGEARRLQSALTHAEQAARLSTSQATNAQSQTAAAQQSVAVAQAEVRTHKEDIAALRKQLQRFEEFGGTAGVLREQVADMRRKIKCNVCNQEDKQVTLTTCFHVFCRPCIDRRIRSRDRKCPGCNKPFGVKDVQPIWLGFEG